MNTTTGAPLLLLAGAAGAIRVVDCHLRKVVWVSPPPSLPSPPLSPALDPPPTLPVWHTPVCTWLFMLTLSCRHPCSNTNQVQCFSGLQVALVVTAYPFADSSYTGD